MKILVGILLILHGLITAMQSGGSFNPTGGVANPKWLGWWPTALGQSWLLTRLGLEKSAAGTLAGVLWLFAGAALVAAGLGLFGFIVPSPWWRTLAAVGAAFSVLLFILYAHPFFLVGLGASLAVLIVLLWMKWPAV
jgi:hypothetical protein